MKQKNLISNQLLNRIWRQIDNQVHKRVWRCIEIHIHSHIQNQNRRQIRGQTIERIVEEISK